MENCEVKIANYNQPSTKLNINKQSNIKEAWNIKFINQNFKKLKIANMNIVTWTKGNENKSAIIKDEIESTYNQRSKIQKQSLI